MVGPAGFMNRFGFTDYAAVALNSYLYCFPGYDSPRKPGAPATGPPGCPTISWESWFTLPYADAVAWNGKIWLVAEATVYLTVQGTGGSLTWSTKTTSAPWGRSTCNWPSFPPTTKLYRLIM